MEPSENVDPIHSTNPARSLGIEAGLVADVRNLAASTDALAQTVERNTAMRKGIVALVVVTCAVLIAFCIISGFALQRITRVDNTAQGLTSVAAQKEQIARADFRTDRTIYCINSFAGSLVDPTKPYDARCPGAYPGQLVAVPPSTP